MPRFSFIQKIPPFFRNRYVLVLVVLGVWMLFFDSSNFISRIKNAHKLNKIEEQKVMYEEQIIKDKQRLKELEDDKEIEKFAREEYHMKKKNEEIFIIEEKD